MTKLKPFAVADGEGRSYVWHDVVFTMKAAAREAGGALSLWNITTKPGEEPHVHVHDDVHEMFYVLTGSITFKIGRKSVRVEKNGFAFVPLGTPHTYTIHSRRVRMLGTSTPSDFGDHIERTGKRVRRIAGRTTVRSL
jgi:mannose-6-phosphate isomerase-like protein (cupin superfamily)